MREILDGDLVFGAEFTAGWRDALSGTAVLNGCGVSINGTGSLGTGGNALSIAAGDIEIDGAENAVGSQNADVSTASSFDRYDLVTADGAGAVNVATGSSERNTPSIPANEAVLAVVEVPSTATAVGDLTVYDSRAVFGHLSNETAHHSRPLPGDHLSERADGVTWDVAAIAKSRVRWGKNNWWDDDISTAATVSIGGSNAYTRNKRIDVTDYWISIGSVDAANIYLTAGGNATCVWVDVYYEDGTSTRVLSSPAMDTWHTVSIDPSLKVDHWVGRFDTADGTSQNAGFAEIQPTGVHL